MTHLQLFSLRHCRSLRYLFSNQLSGTIPPQLGNLTKLTSLYAQSRIALPLTLCIIYDLILIAYYKYYNLRFETFVIICSYVHLQLCSLRHCRSLRAIDFNQLNGTIPPQLGNLTTLTLLYPESHRPLLTLALLLSISLRHLNANQLSGTIPPQLGNLTQLSSLNAQNRIALH